MVTMRKRIHAGNARTRAWTRMGTRMHGVLTKSLIYGPIVVVGVVVEKTVFECFLNCSMSCCNVSLVENHGDLAFEIHAVCC